MFFLVDFTCFGNQEIFKARKKVNIDEKKWKKKGKIMDSSWGIVVEFERLIRITLCDPKPLTMSLRLIQNFGHSFHLRGNCNPLYSSLHQHRGVRKRWWSRRSGTHEPNQCILGFDFKIVKITLSHLKLLWNTCNYSKVI